LPSKLKSFVFFAWMVEGELVVVDMSRVCNPWSSFSFRWVHSYNYDIFTFLFFPFFVDCLENGCVLK
jgi:hypothetical protein